MIEITNYHLDTLREVTDRLTKLANSLPDNRISFCVELSSRPYSIAATAFEWSGIVPDEAIDQDEAIDPVAIIEKMEHIEWYFERDPEEAEQNRIKFLAKVSEWEAKYGVE